MECNNCLPEYYKYSSKGKRNRDHADSKTLGFTPVLYLYGNDAVTIGFKCEDIRRTKDIRLHCKLHLGVSIDDADVPVKSESIQLESKVDVSASTSIRSPVDSDSRSIWVVDLTTVTLLQLFNQVIRKTHSWHSTLHRATVSVSFLDRTRLQQIHDIRVHRTYSALHGIQTTLKRSRMDHSFTCNKHHACLTS